VTDAELRILEVLWDMGPATIRALRDRLYPGGGASKFSTVQTLLSRLDQKGLVGREREADAQTFRALVGREALIGNELRRALDRLGPGSLPGVVTYLVEQATLTDDERARLRELLAAPSAGPRHSRGRRSKPNKKSRR
jgi:predicted transcriptional regulator